MHREGGREVMDSDDLLRSLVDNHARDAGNVGTLLRKKEDDLYALLALRLSAPGAGVGAGEDRFQTAYTDDDLLRSAAAVALGKRVFVRWSLAFHDFLCHPGDEDKKLREQMLNAIISKEGVGLALLAGGLVAGFGLSPAVAAVVAALVVKLVVAPAADEVCRAWGDSLADVRSATTVRADAP
jgi:hypothetical protein